MNISQLKKEEKEQKEQKRVSFAPNVEAKIKSIPSATTIDMPRNLDMSKPLALSSSKLKMPTEQELKNIREQSLLMYADSPSPFSPISPSHSSTPSPEREGDGDGKNETEREQDRIKRQMLKDAILGKKSITSTPSLTSPSTSSFTFTTYSNPHLDYMSKVKMEPQLESASKNKNPRYKSNIDIQDPIAIYAKIAQEEHQNCFKNIKYETIWVNPEDDNHIKLHITGIHDFDMNILRVKHLMETPCLAAYKVIVHKKKCTISMKTLKDRLKNIPITGDPKQFKFLEEVDCRDGPDTTVYFRIRVEIPKLTPEQSQHIRNSGTVSNFTYPVYSSDLKLVSNHNPRKIAPVSPDIHITDLVPGDEIAATIIYTKSIASTKMYDHARWIPGALLNSTIMPRIEVDKSFPEEYSTDLERTCPQKVFDVDIEDLAQTTEKKEKSGKIEKKESKRKIQISRAHDCIHCGECTNPMLPFAKYITVGKKQYHFRLEIHGHGIYTPISWFEHAVGLVQGKSKRELNDILSKGTLDPIVPASTVQTSISLSSDSQHLLAFPEMKETVHFWPGISTTTKPSYIQTRLQITIGKTSRMWTQNMGPHFQKIVVEANKLSDGKPKLTHFFDAIVKHWVFCIISDMKNVHNIPETNLKEIETSLFRYYSNLLKNNPTNDDTVSGKGKGSTPTPTPNEQLLSWISVLCQRHIPIGPRTEVEKLIDHGSVMRLQTAEPSTELKPDQIDAEMKRLRDKPNTFMYSPVSGEMMPERFIVGFNATEVLIKFADVGVKSCQDSAMRNIVNRQAMGSSSISGASRLGKMEIDSLKHHACSTLLHSILSEADFYTIHVCKKHGRLEELNAYCDQCQSANEVRELSVPYSLLLANDHMAWLNMNMYFKLA